MTVVNDDRPTTIRPADLGADARRRRRALLRAHHPDLGGDPAEFIRVSQPPNQSPNRFPNQFPDGTGDTGEVFFVRRPRGLRRVRAWWRLRRTVRPPRVR